MDDNLWYSDSKIPSNLKQVIENTLMFIKCELVGSKFLTDDKELHYPIVGFLRNKESGHHQKLHLNNSVKLTEKQIRNKNVAYIVHLPLSYEGLMLRVPDPKRLSSVIILNKKKYNTNLNDFIYVPLGEALILREDIYHAGNYGSVGNTRFHAMIKPKERKVLTRKLTFLPSGVHEQNISLTPNKVFWEKGNEYDTKSAKEMGARFICDLNYNN